MLKLSITKQLLFEYAQYNLFDGEGHHILLKINYTQNTYDIERKNEITNKSFIEEVQLFAKDLLERKHGKNMV